MDYFLIYLIGIVDDFKETIGFISSLGIAGCLFVFCMFKLQSIDPYSEKEKSIFTKIYTKAFIGFIVSLIALILAGLIPSSKTLIAMATIPPVINNEQVQELPENVLGFINDYLKDKRHELQGVSISPDEV